MNGKKVMVFGMARSGIACAKLLLLRGAEVTICDSKAEDAFGDKLNEIKAAGARFLLNEQHLLTYLKLELRRAFDARILQAQESVLCPYDEKHMQGAVRLELQDAQYEFILDARSCICRAYALGEGAMTYVLDTAGRVTGLAVLLTGENETEIDAMLIDRRYQGRGFGKRMMEEILKSLKEDGTQKVLVAFSPQNTDAAAFYQACGFEAAPQRDEESAFMQIRL